ncbi:MAG TPA: hypothetical protein VKT27_05215 [Candidatus Binataceae bacterium]|nr:hypothetical protein [Candidatus Binataceae bacterium]
MKKVREMFRQPARWHRMASRPAAELLASLMLVSWTLVIKMPGNSAPTTQTGFPTKRACEEAGAKWRSNFETQVKEGTIRTDTDRRRRLARAIPSIICVEDSNAAHAKP